MTQCLRGYFYLPEEKKLFVGLKIASSSTRLRRSLQWETLADKRDVLDGWKETGKRLEREAFIISNHLSTITNCSMNCLSIAHDDCAETQNRTLSEIALDSIG